MSCFPRPPTTFWLLLVDQLRAASVARPPLTQEIGLLAAEFFFLPFFGSFSLQFCWLFFIFSTISDRYVYTTKYFLFLFSFWICVVRPIERALRSNSVSPFRISGRTTLELLVTFDCRNLTAVRSYTDCNVLDADLETRERLSRHLSRCFCASRVPSFRPLSWEIQLMDPSGSITPKGYTLRVKRADDRVLVGHPCGHSKEEPRPSQKLPFDMSSTSEDPFLPISRRYKGRIKTEGTNTRPVYYPPSVVAVAH